MRHFFATFSAEDVFGMAALAAHMHCHVFHNAQNRHADFLEHAYAFHGVNQGNVLRRGDDDRAGQRHALAQRQLDIAGARWHIHNQIIEVAPVGLTKQLF